MIFFKRKPKLDERRRDLALETAKRRESRAQLKKRVDRLIESKPRTGFEPVKG